MLRRPENLAGRQFDLAVIGGGIAGCMAAWDASLRGLSVALVEREDFGAATSAGCYRIVHGGLRYLQSLDFRAMRESIRERNFFLRTLPFLVSPLPVLVPTRRGEGLSSRLPLSIAIRLNDWISNDRNRDIRESSHQIPSGRMLPADGVRALCPFLPTENLTGGAVFYDGVMQNTERVVYCVAEAAAQGGAVVVNHAEAEGQPVGDRLSVRDRISQQVYSLQAKAFLYATGPWLGGAAPRRYSAGIQLVTDPIPTGGHALAFRTASGKRYFAMPWRGVTVWGTADFDYFGTASGWSIGDGQVDSFLREINQALPGLGLAREQVRKAFGGLRPCGSEVSAGAASRSARFGFQDGVYWMEATKFTTARLLAEQTLDFLLSRAGISARPAQTFTTPLPHGLGNHRTDSPESCQRAVTEESALTGEDICRRCGYGQSGPLSALESAWVQAALDSK